MPDVQQHGVFMLAGLLLNLTPGPDVLFIVSQSLRGGVRAGWVAAWGITAGCCVHVMAAAMGVGAVLATSAAAFHAIQWVGAAYLVWMGARMLWPRAPWRAAAVGPMPAAQASLQTTELANAQPCTMALRRVFFKAFVTNALNPKVALFFLAFVPQFIPATAADPVLSFLALGGLFVFNGWLVCMAWAVAAAGLTRRGSGWQRAMARLDRCAGAMFIGFGLQLALIEPPAH